MSDRQLRQRPLAPNVFHRPPGVEDAPPIGSKWLYKIRLNPDGTEGYKVRLASEDTYKCMGLAAPKLSLRYPNSSPFGLYARNN